MKLEEKVLAGGILSLLVALGLGVVAVRAYKRDDESAQEETPVNEKTETVEEDSESAVEKSIVEYNMNKKTFRIIEINDSGKKKNEDPEWEEIFRIRKNLVDWALWFKFRSKAVISEITSEEGKELSVADIKVLWKQFLEDPNITSRQMVEIIRNFKNGAE